MNHTYAVLFWINRAKANKNGHVPIYARVTVNGKRAEIATGRYIESERWNVKEGNVKGNKENARTINISLINIRDSLNSLFNQLSSNKDFSNFIR